MSCSKLQTQPFPKRNKSTENSNLPPLALQYARYDGIHPKNELTDTIFAQPGAIALMTVSVVPFILESPEFCLLIYLHEFCLFHGGTVVAGSFLLFGSLL